MKKTIFSMLAALSAVALFGNEPEDNNKKDQETSVVTPVVSPDQNVTSNEISKDAPQDPKPIENPENK